jgi:hypothetical protein
MDDLNRDKVLAILESGIVSTKGMRWLRNGDYISLNLDDLTLLANSARRTAPVSSPIGEDIADINLPALPDDYYMLAPQHLKVYDEDHMRDYARQHAAPYAARIRQLERELAERKQSIDTEEALAWAAFAENGNVIIWSRRRDEVEPVAAKYGRPVTPIIAYIDGRTAGTVDGWRLVPMVATKDMLHAGMRHFHDKPEPASKAWEAYRDMIAAAPTPMNSGKEEGND